jgi:hypothetical protein
MAIEGKTAIPDLGDTAVIDHTLLGDGVPSASAVAAVGTGSTPGGSLLGGGTTNGFGSSSSGSSAFGAPASGGFGASSSSSGFGSSGFGGSSSPAPASSGFGSSTPAQTGPQMNLTQAGGNAAQGADVLVKTDDKFGNFVNSKWRPLMAFIYMITCTCDFVIFPVLWSVLQALTHGNVTSQWQPLTLQGAGLYHLAMGAVLGVAAYGRTKEKVSGTA